MKSPIVIILELLAGLITNAITTIGFVILKLGELMVSLLFLSTFGIFGFLIAILIGVVVFFFLAKVIFKTSGSLISLIIAAAVVFLVLILLSMVV